MEFLSNVPSNTREAGGKTVTPNPECWGSITTAAEIESPRLRPTRGLRNSAHMLPLEPVAIASVVSLFGAQPISAGGSL
ncbi:hypothetical protein DNTS_033431 [Danionella cerebrum]|uniref:Uncharacterized protein n=1 Tax=Danionella cerebrum TaxID=2873325 RepID=A0A553R949_9TELE|nr:hypothetical protein DNTS_033431 [Danionella translucida]